MIGERGKEIEEAICIGTCLYRAEVCFKPRLLISPKAACSEEGFLTEIREDQEECRVSTCRSQLW
jgi:hypothetical protein